jgi:hypothetical protein
MMPTMRTPNKNDVPDNSTEECQKAEVHTPIPNGRKLTENPAEDGTTQHGDKTDAAMGMKGETTKTF